MPESEEDIEAIIEHILGVVQPEQFDGFTREEVEVRVAELNRDIELIHIKLAELDHADKAYLDREDLINPINEKQFNKMVAINKKVSPVVEG